VNINYKPEKILHDESFNYLSLHWWLSILRYFKL